MRDAGAPTATVKHYPNTLSARIRKAKFPTKFLWVLRAAQRAALSRQYQRCSKLPLMSESDSKMQGLLAERTDAAFGHLCYFYDRGSGLRMDFELLDICPCPFAPRNAFLGCFLHDECSF